MPRPPAAPFDSFVDADVCARAGSTIERQFSGTDLPRLDEAGVRVESSIDARFRFAPVESFPAVEGVLRGTVSMTCQRCMGAVPVAIDEGFRVVVVPEEREDELGGYEPVVANPGRLDLRWLAEEQMLLALPLVPMHEGEECVQGPEPAAPGEQQEGAVQQPFRNLRDMLRQR